MGEILGLIPARGGSKGIPGKNLVLLAGRPLLAHTCEAALKAKTLGRVILSTDDEEIAACGRACGVEVPFLRPKDLASDASPMIDVVRHALDALRTQGDDPDRIVLLQPTSPLRQARHIDDAVRLMDQARAETVVSVVELPHRFHPYSVLQEAEGVLRDAWPQPLSIDRFRRQALPRLFARNGPAVLVVKTAVIRAHRTFYHERVVPYLMDEQDSIDIDTPHDLEIAEWLLSRRQAAA